MKFKLIETFLTEGKNIEQTWVKYKDKMKAIGTDGKRRIFDDLIKLDPTYKEGLHTTGLYGEWILNQYSKGNLSGEQSLAEISTALREFEKNKKIIKNKDINSYKTVDDLFDAIDNAQPSERQLARQQKRANSAENIQLLYEDDDWLIYTPLTYAGSVYLGKGTEWCTASQSIEGIMNYACYTGDEYAIADDTLFSLGYDEDDVQYVWEEFSYTDPDRFGNLYVIINKKNPSEKYQFHMESDSYMDAHDNPISLKKFCTAPKLKGVTDYLVNNCGLYLNWLE